MAADGDAPAELDSATRRDEAAAKPLLSPPSPAPAPAPTPAAQETLEELDRRYAPYARRDAYGPMGRGPLGAAEAARLAVAADSGRPRRSLARSSQPPSPVPVPSRPEANCFPARLEHARHGRIPISP